MILGRRMEDSKPTADLRYLLMSNDGKMTSPTAPRGLLNRRANAISRRQTADDV